MSARAPETVLRFGILTVSDRSSTGLRPDASGPALEGMISTRGWKVYKRLTVPDDQATIRKTLISWVDLGDLDIILTTGGTGFSPRDVTPEATQGAIDRHAPGLAEAMRHASLRSTPHAMLSRGIAGIRNRTLIVNLPGSPKAATENLDVIVAVLPHAVQLLREDPRSEAGHA
jgi:molybdenum cofactor synthesis domain-containing protein